VAGVFFLLVWVGRDGTTVGSLCFSAVTAALAGGRLLGLDEEL
jgi:hypothetical protein